MRTSFLFLLRRPVCSRCASLLETPAHQRFASNSKIGPFRKAVLLPEDGPREPARTRFAPSPTGYLHLGSLRTALFNYLLAKATGGQFILRIEDTDRSRLVEDAEKRLYEDLKWTGLSWDEGRFSYLTQLLRIASHNANSAPGPDVGGDFGPYRQSERSTLYQSHVETLIQQGKAYRCFCSPEALERHKAEAHLNGTSTHYPGTCRHIPFEESESRRNEYHAVRFKSSPTPVEFWDLVYNRYKKSDPEEDYVLIKRDGFPTYHFANVVDDHLMQITHVVRGAEWLISTPKHIELYEAFGWTAPKFAHLGLLVNKDGQKLSKRHGGFDIQEYREDKILPTSLLNFVALHGWRRRGMKSDIMTLDVMVKMFDLSCSKGDIAVSFDKLPYLETKHRRLLVDKDPPNMAVLSDLWVGPIYAAVTRVDRSLRRGNKAPLGHITVLPHRFHGASERDGELVHHLQRRLSEQAQDYIVKALRLSSKLPDPHASIEGWVADNEHIFWRPTSALLAERLRAIPFDSVYFNGEPSDPARAIRYFLKIARSIEMKQLKGYMGWDLEAVQAGFADNVKRFTYMDQSTKQDVRAGGSIFLRWALLGGNHGPALIPIMELFGRQETVSRLERALEVATSWQQQSKALKQENTAEEILREGDE